MNWVQAATRTGQVVMAFPFYCALVWPSTMSRELFIQGLVIYALGALIYVVAGALEE